MKSAIIIPTYNEVDSLPLLINKINKLKINSYIVVVDDNSPDGTGSLADKLAKKNTKIKVIHRKAKLGLGTAYIAGFDQAFKLGCEVVITMDADLSHDPKVLPKMLRLIADYDIVIGSRHTKGGSIEGFDLFRHSLSKSAQLVSKYLLGLPAYDSTSGYRAYRKAVIKAIKIKEIKSQGYSFLIEALYKANKKGFSVIEVPIRFQARSLGQSKLSQNEIKKALITSGRLSIHRFFN